MEYDDNTLNWAPYLPPEIWNIICSFISTSSLLRLSQASKEIRTIALMNIEEYCIINDWNSLKTAHLTPNIKKFKAEISLPSHLTYFSQLPDLFKNLIDMDISIDDNIHYRIKKLDSFSKLTNLQRLRTDCWNSISSDVLAHCTRLTSLHSSHIISELHLLSMTQLKEYSTNESDYYSRINISKLSNLEKLKTPSPVSGVEKLQNLRVISLSPSVITKAIKELPNLERVGAFGDINNGVLDELRDRSRVTHLRVPGNNLGDLSNLTNLTQLRSLEIHTNQIEVVTKMTWLTKLKISSRELDSLARLSKNLTNLKYLGYTSYYYNHPIFDEQLTKLQNLETLICGTVTMLDYSSENFRRVLIRLQNLRRVNVVCNELDWMSLKKLNWHPIEELIVNYMTIWS
jgi:hypothetical protein